MKEAYSVKKLMEFVKIVNMVENSESEDDKQNNLQNY